MLVPDGVYVKFPDGLKRLRWIKASSWSELTHLTEILAHRIGLYLERQGPL
jgi:hypothetical protein